MAMNKNILITGPPGIGKTTLIMKILDRVKKGYPVGFYTKEIRDQGVRIGFELISLDGERSILSHVKISSPYRVGKYRVDVNGFEAFLESLPFADPAPELIIIDEIGKMELMSEKFRSLITELLDSPKPVIATIALKGGGLIARIKEREDVKLYEINLANRDRLLNQLL
jgi:nucleoside-triphosphatase